MEEPRNPAWTPDNTADTTPPELTLTPDDDTIRPQYPQQTQYPPQQTPYGTQAAQYPPQQAQYPPQQTPYTPQQSPAPGEYVPQLTLNPDAPGGGAVSMPDIAGAAAALDLSAQQAQSPFAQPSAAAVQQPQSPFAQQSAAAVQQPQPAPVPAQPVPLEIQLSPAEEQRVDEFSRKIDIRDSHMVLSYGSAAQKNIVQFSDEALQSVRTKDLGEIGDSLTALVVSLNSMDMGQEETKKGLRGMFRKPVDKMQAIKTQYSKVSETVDRISKELRQHQITLLKDVAMLDRMYEENLRYYKELTMYILAGQRCLERIRSTELAALRTRAEQTGSQEDAQRYNDMAQLCERFEKKLHDLDLTRMVSLQMGPQTRMLQNNDVEMAEKIQASLMNTIPLWKNQMVLALGMEHGRQAMATQAAVTEMTNDLLRKNAEMLKMGTIATAKEAERGIVDLETLQYTNQQLISTIDEVLTIQRDGTAKRRAAEVELRRIEGELRKKLMENV